MIGRAKRVDCERGFTLVELLIVILIIGILLAVALPTFLNQQDKANDTRAQTTVVNSIRTSKALYVGNNDNYAPETSLVWQLSSDQPQYSYHAYNSSANPSTGPDDVSVTRDSSSQVSLCAKSSTGRVYCERSNEIGALLAEAPSEDSLLAELSPLQLVFPESAQASGRRTVSTCVGTVEADVRACLASSSASATSTGDATEGWSSTPTPDSTPPPPPPTLSYADEVGADGPSAQCPFDETGSAYVNLQCAAINGQLQDQSPRFTTQQAGAILSSSSDRAVSFNGATHYSYGNPSSASTNNQGQNWSAEVWVKPNSSSSGQAIVSADDNWALRFAGSNGFTCDTRLGNPWSVVSITGGPASSAGTWYMVDCTYNSGVLALYVNGALVAQQSGVGTGQSGNGNFRPGYVSSGWTGGSYLNGTLDQFTFYKSTLSPARITAHYRAAGY